MTVSNATTKALQAVEDSGGVLVLLLIDNAALSGPVRLVNDTRDWTISGTTYIGLPFRFKLPQDKTGENPRAQIEIDNVGRDLTGELERLGPAAWLQATVRLVHRSTPTVIDYEFTAALTNVRVTVKTISATIGPDDIMRRPAVCLRFDQATAPGLFPG